MSEFVCSKYIDHMLYRVLMAGCCVTVRHAACKLELRNLVVKKRDQHSSDQMTKDLLDNAAWENRPPPPNWRRRGQLVAHLHEHKGAVNR